MALAWHELGPLSNLGNLDPDLELLQQGSDLELGASFLHGWRRARPAWWADAACRGVGARVFFAANTARARGLCRTCPVSAACAQAGQDEPAGVWGGIDRDALLEAEHRRSVAAKRDARRRADNESHRRQRERRRAEAFAVAAANAPAAPPPPAADAPVAERVQWLLATGNPPLAVARLLNREQTPPPAGDTLWRTKHIKALAG